jgi:serine/threonine protein kinase
MEDISGMQLGPYRIVEPLGEGGMAAVYKAYQATMDRYVAVKVLPRFFASDREFVRRFEQEAKVLARLQHPHILPIYDFGEQEGYTCPASRSSASLHRLATRWIMPTRRALFTATSSPATC